MIYYHFCQNTDAYHSGGKECNCGPMITKDRELIDMLSKEFVAFDYKKANGNQGMGWFVSEGLID